MRTALSRWPISKSPLLGIGPRQTALSLILYPKEIQTACPEAALAVLPAVAALAETLGTRPGHSFPSFRESGVIRVVPGISLRCPPSHDEWLDNLDALPGTPHLPPRESGRGYGAKCQRSCHPAASHPNRSGRSFWMQP